MLCQVNPKVIPIGPLLLPSDFPTPNDTVIADHESEESASLMQWHPCRKFQGADGGACPRSGGN
jgi:hypothetical protein